jgi:hypothetical protein
MDGQDTVALQDRPLSRQPTPVLLTRMRILGLSASLETTEIIIVVYCRNKVC